MTRAKSLPKEVGDLKDIFLCCVFLQNVSQLADKSSIESYAMPVIRNVV